MPAFRTLKKYFSNYLPGLKETEPAAAYNLWATTYDSQPDNLMLAMDEELVSDLLSNINIENKIAADIGCGTGRHWKKIIERHPKKLIGFDVSEEMLKILQNKFPSSETHLLINNELSSLDNESCDIIFSTLTIAHIKDINKALTEWSRVLKPGGNMIITDYHPTALAKGGKRTFSYNRKTVAVKNYVHSIAMLKEIAKQLGLQQISLIEKLIDETTKPYYEKQNALSIFEAWKGMPIIYGIHLKKTDAAL